MILFSAIYVLSSIGLSVRVHYCGNNVAEIKVLPGAGSCCCDEMEEAADCCRDEATYIQVEADQIATHFDLQLQSPADDVLAHHENVQDLVANIESQIVHEEVDHPPPRGCPKYLLNQSLIIYG